ncbi:MAG: hypothetical protein K8R35_01725 [Bacteroidales bacterium]|nr:hypothetical protein [Bacteroidales bacterium]
MEDIGGIIFYIIAAIIGIIGLMNKKKKNQASAKKVVIPSQTGDEDLIFENIDEEEPVGNVFAMSGINYNEASADSDKTGARLVMDASYEGNYREPMADDFAGEGVSAIEHKDADSEELNEEESENKTDPYHNLIEEQSVAAEIAADFDLPKAIVYSEILKRKDYF